MRYGTYGLSLGLFQSSLANVGGAFLSNDDFVDFTAENIFLPLCFPRAGRVRAREAKASEGEAKGDGGAQKEDDGVAKEDPGGHEGTAKAG